MARRLIVTGRVQGVFFRDSTREEAARLGARGWVRNREDGSVEALLDGPHDAVDALVRWAHHGPPAAEVTAVRAEDLDDEVPEGFEVR